MSKRTAVTKTASEKRQLAPKESGLFKELLNLYETRQLKRALKTADQILKKVADHGETTSMRGLVLIHMGRRDEGMEQVKKGAKLDLTSHIVWHVFGLVQKAEKNWVEAAKSYSMGLRFDKENQNILRDLAQLQTHIRQYDALIESRRQLLRIRTNLRQNWIAYAVAYHLADDIKNSTRILSLYQSMVKHVPDYDVDHSETLLYHIRVLLEYGLYLKAHGTEEDEFKKHFEQALSILDINAKARAIVDRTKILEFRAHLLTHLSSPDAENAWLNLIDHNSDHLGYYQSYLSLFPSSPELLLEKTLHLSSIHPKSRLPRRRALDFSSSSTTPTFKDLVTPYLKESLDKGIPSLFTELKSLYEEEEKIEVIRELVEEMIANEKDIDPSMHLWALYFLAQHYSYLSVNGGGGWRGRIEQGKKALVYVERAIQHTPTMPELWAAKARIHKRLSSPAQAAYSIQMARLIDGQDRFINTKTAKYLLRLASSAPLPSLSTPASPSTTSFSPAYEAAQQVLGLFTKKDVSSPGQDLEDMQSNSYLVENAKAWEGLGGKEGLGRSLKCVEAVVKVFHTYQDDQYDFHPYAVRKCNLNVYLDLVRWEASLYLDSMYVKAVVGGVKILVNVYDNPKRLEQGLGNGDDALTSSQSKKAKKKAAKKAHALAHQSNNTTPNLSSGGGNTPANHEDKGIEPPSAKDDDPDGTKWLLMCSESGGEKKVELVDKAWEWLMPIVNLLVDGGDGKWKVKADGFVDDGRRLGGVEERGVWEVVYDVCVRRGKWMLALKALHHLKSLGGDEDVHWRIVDLVVRSMDTPPNPAIQPAFSSSLSSLLAPSSFTPSSITEIEQYNTAFLQTSSNSSIGGKVFSWAMGLWLIKGEEGKDEVIGALFGMIKRMQESGGEVEMDVETALQIQTFLHYKLDLPLKAEEWRVECGKVYELSDVFEGPEKRIEEMKWASSEVGMPYLEEVKGQDVLEEKE